MDECVQKPTEPVKKTYEEPTLVEREDMLEIAEGLLPSLSEIF